MRTSHHHTDSQSTAYSEDVDSTANTVVASPETSRWQSLDEPWKDLHRDKDGRWRRRSQDSGSEQSSDGDDDSLLSQEDGPLVRQQSTADAVGDHEPPLPPVQEKEKPISWMQLPKKSQLAILTLARLSEPLTQTSLQAYMFYQLKSFKLPNGSSPSDETVSKQAGLLAAAFTGAQFMTAIMWGRLADSERMGRKRVMLVGLLGTAIGSLGFGFSKSFAAAVFWRCVAGFLNGNIGVMRTMISEIIKEKRFQSRAFLLLPMTFNIGVIIGPLLGGLLADPVGSYPGIFGPGGSIGGQDGVWWMTEWPYALPNVVSAVFLTTSTVALFFGLEETLEGLKDKPDYGLRFTRWVGRFIFRIQPKQHYVALDEQEALEEDVEGQTRSKQAKKPGLRRKLPFNRIWTPNVLFTLLSHGLLAMHVGTFNNLWFVFLSTPRYDPESRQHTTRSAESSQPAQPVTVPADYTPHLPFRFTGGLALPPPSIGTALAILGVIGISLQLLLYPRLNFRLGTVRSLRYALLLFPITYFLAPFLAILPSSRPPPEQASGAILWVGIALVLCIQVLGRTFALPASAILVNNSSPHPSVLGTLHGIAQSVSSATRTVGPALGGWIYAVGLERGVVGAAWWTMAGVAVVGAIAGQFVWEGDGHEIWLEGERDEIDDR